MQRTVFVVVKQATVIVLSHSPLSAGTGRFFNQLSILKPVPHTRVGRIQPVVQAVHQAILCVLRISRTSVLPNQNLLITSQITINIFAEPEIWRFGHQNAALNK